VIEIGLESHCTRCAGIIHVTVAAAISAATVIVLEHGAFKCWRWLVPHPLGPTQALNQIVGSVPQLGSLATRRTPDAVRVSMPPCTCALSDAP
jgi:hypothetical protein